MSQTTISVRQNLNTSSVDGVRYRAKRLRLHFEKSLSYRRRPSVTTVCLFCCTNRWQIPTFASGMQASYPLWAPAASTLQPTHGV